MTRITKNIECKECGYVGSIDVDLESYTRWQQGLGLIQDEMPELEDWERELLISHTCNECWLEMFPEDEDDE